MTSSDCLQNFILIIDNILFYCYTKKQLIIVQMYFHEILIDNKDKVPKCQSKNIGSLGEKRKEIK